SGRICPDCHGARLKPEALAVTIGGRNVVQVTRLSIILAQRFFDSLEETAPVATQPALQLVKGNGKKKNDNGSRLGDALAKINPNGPLVLTTLTERERFIARQVLKEIRAR